MQNIPRSEPICVTSKLVNVKEVSISSIFVFFIFIRILVGFGQPDKKNRFWPQLKVVDPTILLGKWENRGSNLRISETMIKKEKKKRRFGRARHSNPYRTEPEVRETKLPVLQVGKKGRVGSADASMWGPALLVILKQHDCSRKCISSERNFHVDPTPHNPQNI